jgi:hypothetical protein
MSCQIAFGDINLAFRRRRSSVRRAYFGLLAFGRVYSSIFAAFGLAGALGPLMMGDSIGPALIAVLLLYSWVQL